MRLPGRPSKGYEDIFEKLRLEQKELRMERLRLSTIRQSMRSAQQDLDVSRSNFEARMVGFRKVCTVAWDAVIADRSEAPEIRALEHALSSTDHLWEGFAGCTRDHEEVAIA